MSKKKEQPKPVELQVAFPDPKIFGFAPPKKNNLGVAGNLPRYQLERVEYPEEGGILLYHKGLLLPKKGFPFPEAISRCNIAKRALVNALRLASSKPFWAMWLFMAFTSFKYKVTFLNNILEAFVSMAIPIVRPIAPMKKYQIDVAREIMTLIETFLLNIGVHALLARDFAFVFGTCINYDNAYHFRAIDVFSEIDKEKLKANPAKEIKRVLEIYKKREKQPISEKFESLYKVLRLAFLSKKIREAFSFAVETVNWEKLRYDAIDRYNVLEAIDYDYLGKSYEERYAAFKQLHGGNPPPTFSYDVET